MLGIEATLWTWLNKTFDYFLQNELLIEFYETKNNSNYAFYDSIHSIINEIWRTLNAAVVDISGLVDQKLYCPGFWQIVICCGEEIRICNEG